VSSTKRSLAAGKRTDTFGDGRHTRPVPALANQHLYRTGLEGSSPTTERRIDAGLEGASRMFRSAATWSFSLPSSTWIGLVSGSAAKQVGFSTECAALGKKAAFTSCTSNHRSPRMREV